MKIWNTKQIHNYASKQYKDSYQAIHYAPSNTNDSANQDIENRRDAEAWRALAHHTDVNMVYPQKIAGKLQHQILVAGDTKRNGVLSPKDVNTTGYLYNQSKDIMNNLKNKNQKQVQKHLLLLNQKLITSDLKSVAPIYKTPLHKTVDKLNHAYINVASYKPLKAPANIVKNGYLKNIIKTGKHDYVLNKPIREAIKHNHQTLATNNHYNLIKDSRRAIQIQQAQEKYVNKTLKDYLQGNSVKAANDRLNANEVTDHAPNDMSAVTYKVISSPRLSAINRGFISHENQIPTKDSKTVQEQLFLRPTNKKSFKYIISQAPKDIQQIARKRNQARQHKIDTKRKQINRSKGQKKINWLKKAFKGINEKQHSSTHNLKKNEILHAHKQHKQNIGIASKKQVREAKRNQGREI